MTAVSEVMSHDQSIATVRQPLAPAQRDLGEVVFDAVLRGAWLLVGVYVWIVLLFKRRGPARRG